MAIVGDAYIVVKAITTGFESEVRRAANGINLNREGSSVGDTFSRGFSRGIGNGLGNSLSSFERSAIAARKQFQALVRTSYFLGPALSMLVSTIGTLAGGLVSLASSLVAAAPSAIVFASALTSIGIAAVGLLGALSGVAKAISAGTKAKLAGKKNSDAYQESLKRLALATERVAEAQRDFAEAAEAAREEVQQLGFDAEDAALSESKAAIELEKARETLQRVQDLPPNSRARREANLAFQEAELNLRRAKDKNSDLRKEQERLAKAAVIAGTTQAEQTDTYLDAQKRVIDAVRDQQDAQDAVNKAKEGGTQDNNFQQALSDLSKEAQGFVRYMVGTFIPSLKTLRDALGKQLFSQLESNLERLRTQLFPALRPALEQLGNDLGKAFTKITDAIVKPENIKKLTDVIRQSGISIQSFATSIGSVYEIFLTLLRAAEPLINRFNKFIENKLASWADSLNLKEASGELRDFFNKAGDIGAKIGAIFGNVFRTIGNIVKANFAPGGGGHILLDWLKEVTNRWDTFSGSVTGQQKLTKYFRDVAINAKAVLSTIGAFLKEILKAGADPNVAAFWNTLKQGAPAFGELLTSLNTAGPALAKFIVAFINFAKVTLSSGAITVFIGILTGALNMLTKILDNPGMQALFNTGAKILAVGLAFGSLSKVLSFAVRVIAGSFISLGKAFKFLLNPMTSLRAVLVPAISSMAGAVGLAVGPFLAIAAAIAAVIAILVLAYNKSEIFREAIAKLVEAVSGALSRAFGTIKTALSEVTPALSDMGNVFKSVGDFLGKYIVPIFQVILVGAIDAFAEAIALVIRVVKGLWQILTGSPIEGLKTILGGLGTFIVNTFRNIWNNVRSALSNIPIFNSLLSGAESVFKAIAGLWNRTLGKIKFTTPDWVPGIGGKGFAFPTINLAEGGVIQPTPGGTMARIGEAGRPERVEPLDPDGLSKRDKAMIQLLSGGRGAGMTVNVYPSPGMDETELASLVSRQIAFQLRRGGA
jgi:hypothetical protein